MSDALGLHPHTLRPRETALVLVDMQEAFARAIADFDLITARIGVLIEGAKLLNLPILATEQSPKKLGRTVKELLERLPASTQIVEKTAFSCCGAAPFIEQLQATRARQIILCGIEAHVCVNQSAHDLLARGFQVHLALDCISSRTAENRRIGIDKMLQSGAMPCGVELAFFELMRDAQHEQFRAVQKLIR